MGPCFDLATEYLHFLNAVSLNPRSKVSGVFKMLLTAAAKFGPQLAKLGLLVSI
jgi:hypothetical protein